MSDLRIQCDAHAAESLTAASDRCATPGMHCDRAAPSAAQTSVPQQRGPSQTLVAQTGSAMSRTSAHGSFEVAHDIVGSIEKVRERTFEVRATGYLVRMAFLALRHYVRPLETA